VGHVIEIKKGAGPEAFFALPAGIDLGVFGFVDGAFEYAVGFDEEIDALLEEERAADEDTFGDDERAAAGGSDFVTLQPPAINFSSSALVR
jgi:hypothetical protein